MAGSSVVPKKVFTRNYQEKFKQESSESGILKCCGSKSARADGVKRREMIMLTFGLVSRVVMTGNHDAAQAAGLPEEDKPRLCDDECVKELENVW